MERNVVWGYTLFLGIYFGILFLEVKGEIGNNVEKGTGFSARNMLQKIATTLMSRAGTTSSQVSTFYE